MIVDNQIIDAVLVRVKSAVVDVVRQNHCSVLPIKQKLSLFTPFIVYLANKDGVFAEAVCDEIIDGNAGPQQWVFITENCGLSGSDIYRYCRDKETQVVYPFGLRLVSIKIYNEPKSATEFTLTPHCFNISNIEITQNCFDEYVAHHSKNSFCRACKYYDGDWGDCGKHYRLLLAIPKNFCYVEPLR